MLALFFSVSYAKKIQLREIKKKQSKCETLCYHFFGICDIEIKILIFKTKAIESFVLKSYIKTSYL